MSFSLKMFAALLDLWVYSKINSNIISNINSNIRQT